MWCGTMLPMPILKSASNTSRLMWIRPPFFVVPRSTCASGSRKGWFMMGTRRTASAPNFPRISASVMNRWVPRAMMTLISLVRNAGGVAFVEENGNDGLSRGWAGDVIGDEHDLLLPADEVPKRRRADRVGEAADDFAFTSKSAGQSFGE